MFNRVIMIGNNTKDPELRHTAGGTPVTTMRIAVESKFKQGDTQEKEILFIDVVAFGKQAESCKEYVGKGSAILVEGRLKERHWESEGVKRSKFEIMANNVRFLNRKNTGATDTEKPDLMPDGLIDDAEPF